MANRRPLLRLILICAVLLALVGIGLFLVWQVIWSIPTAPAPPPTAVSTQPAQPEALAGIGGVVENEAKSPIPGVKIRIGWQENPLTPGARPSYHSKTVTTNAAGQWVLPAVKPASTVSVSLQLTHRDYALQDLFGTSLDKLAAHTFIATLTPGLTVTGQVVDASGNPVAGATITSK